MTPYARAKSNRKDRRDNNNNNKNHNKIRINFVVVRVQRFKWNIFNIRCCCVTAATAFYDPMMFTDNLSSISGMTETYKNGNRKYK